MVKIKIILTVGLIFIMSNSVFASMRIISLAPNVTEILFALDLSSQIVGVSSYCDYPPAVSKIESVGDFSHPSIERIVSLEPDIVFTAGIEQKDITVKLRKLDIRVEVIKPVDIDALYRNIIEIGQITKRVKKSKVLIADIKESIRQVKKAYKNVDIDKKPTVFILLWHDPLLTAGANSFVSDVITNAGGINVAGDLLYPYSRYNLEVLIEKAPDYILVCSMENSDSNAYLEKISNLTGADIINDINPDIILRPGPRITKGIKKIYKRLYENEK